MASYSWGAVSDGLAGPAGVHMLLSSSLSLLMLFHTFSGGVSATHDDVPARSDPGSEVPAQTIRKAHEVLDTAMPDYTRARFKNVRAVYVDAKADHTGDPIRAVVFCGEVNAPNRFGGMAGWMPFYLRPDTEVFPFGTSPGFNPRLYPACQPGAGTPVDGADYSSALTYSSEASNPSQ